MGTASAFIRILRKHIRMHAAWVPVVTKFNLGDYGVWKDGLFKPIGNISDFGIEIDEVRGEAARLDFVSKSMTSTYVTGAGKVDALPETDIDVAMEIDASKGDGFFLKSASLSSRRMNNVGAAAAILNRARKRGEELRWRWYYKVVSEIFEAEDLTLLATRERKTKIVIRGKADALRQFELGGVSAGLEFNADKQLALTITGDAGSVGLGLFRVRVGGAPIVFGDDGSDEDDAGEDEEALIIHEQNWEDDPEDDPEEDDSAAS